jgi:hypothetical protein
MLELETKPSIAIKMHKDQFCWLSGYDDRKRPAGWYAPWWMQIAHIASGGGRARRCNDVRGVVLLSPLAHACHVSNSDSHPEKTINGVKYPTIDERHTIWLKRRYDPENYDIEFLKTIWIGIPPEPECPPEFWCRLMLKNRGIVA